jgi:DNA-3-methyladenine glycosylase II
MNRGQEDIGYSIRTAQRRLISVSQKYHPTLADVIKKNGVIEVRSPRDRCLVEFLAGIVISQQLSSRASETIWSRVVTLREIRKQGFKSLFSQENFSDLCKCGISKAKVKALIKMADAHRVGRIKDSDIRRADYETIRELILSLWGFGPWSADMVAMFFANLPDVWPEGDVALERGLRLLAPQEEPRLVAAHYSPYRTYLARHVWRGLDTGIIVE